MTSTATSSSFPDGFLWGVATAAHQVEGANTNNDVWFLEHVPGTFFREPSGDAIDHFTRYRHDIALIASLGFTSYRFSLEWSRIEPAKGEFSAAAIAHYRDVLLACHEHGLTPVVTYHHFSSPLWLLSQGGWEAQETVELFARFCTRVTQDLGDLFEIACTLNEPNLAVLLAELGIVERTPAQRAGVPMWESAAALLNTTPDKIATFQMTATAESFAVKCAAHRAGSAAIKAIKPSMKVGWTLANPDIQAIPGGEEHAERARQDINIRYLEISRGDDFVGIQTYGRTVFTAEGLAPAPEGAALNTAGEEIYPAAIGATVREAWEIARVPVFVTENGLNTDDDTQRVAFYQDAIEAVKKCIDDAIPMLGYTAWTAFDNFEWIFGYSFRFGLIAVDRETQERTVKPSAQWLGQVAARNGLER